MRILVPNLSGDSGGNRDLPLLYGEMAKLASISVKVYSGWSAISGWPDIIHVYWPEWLINRAHGPVVTAADCARVLAELSLARARGAKIVWTANNLRPHETDRLGLVNSFVSAFSRLVDQVVCPAQTALDQFLLAYPALVGVDQRIIPPGTYRGFYPDDDISIEDARRMLDLPPDKRIVLSFGMVRPYKNIPQMLRCHSELLTQRDDIFLLVAGEPMPESLGTQIHRMCAGIQNVRADLHRIAEDEVQYYLRAANCVVIGTSFAVNTNVALLALAFDRPVLLPHRGAALEYRDVAGSDWVHTYDGGMRPAVLDRAYDIKHPAGNVALGERYEWSSAAADLHAAYSDLLEHQK